MNKAVLPVCLLTLSLSCAPAGARELKRLDKAAGLLAAELLKTPGLEGAAAVAPFKSPGGEISVLGGLLAERLNSRLIRSGKLAVLDRRYLGRVLGELKLQMSGLTEQADSATAGRLTGARFLLLGGLEPLGKNQLAISCRLVDTRTGRAAASARAELRLDGETRSLYARVSKADTEAEKFFEERGAGPGADGLKVELLLSQESFRPGQAARAVVTVSTRAEVYLYSVDREGKAARLFPRPGESGLTEAGRPLLFPSEADEAAGTRLEAALPPAARRSEETLRAFAVRPGPGDPLAGAAAYGEITGRLESSGRAWAEAARVFTIVE